MRRAGGALRSRSLIPWAGAVLFLIAMLLPGSARAITVAPAFTLTDVDANTIHLSDFQGRITLLDFMYVGCASCEIARPVLEQVYAAHTSVMTGVSIDVLPLDTESALRSYRDAKGIPWHVAKDTDGVQAKYGVSAVVRIFLINQDGVVIYDKEGMNLGEEASLRSAVEASIADALSGRAPAFSLVDIDGILVNLTQFRGRIVLLEFMYIGNASSEAARPVLKTVYANHSAIMTGVSIDIRPQDTDAALRTYRSANNITWHVTRDTDNVSGRYGVTSVAHIVLVSQGGLVAFKQRGLAPGGERNLSAGLERAIAGLTPPRPGDNLQVATILALTAAAAVTSFFSPCSFPMFPGYMSYFLGLDTAKPDQPKSRWRSVFYGVISSFGIILVYGIIGAAILAIGAAAGAVVPALQLVVGGILIFMGALMFTPLQFNFLVNPFRSVRRRIFPNWTPNAVQTTSGKLFSYGVGYGAAGFGCVAPTFIGAIFLATGIGGLGAGIAVLGLYAGIVVALMIAITFVLATVGQAVVKKINRYTEIIKKISAAVLVVAGVYLVYYWYTAWVA